MAALAAAPCDASAEPLASVVGGKARAKVVRGRGRPPGPELGADEQPAGLQKHVSLNSMSIGTVACAVLDQSCQVDSSMAFQARPIARTCKYEGAFYSL